MQEFEIWLWLAALIGFSVLEALTAAMVSLWFIVGALAAFVCALLDFGFLAQLTVFAVVSLLTLALLRPYVKSRLYPKHRPTNADMLFGRTVEVSEAIPEGGTGRTVIDGLSWAIRTADGKPADVGARLRVESIEGVTLIARRFGGNEGE